VFEAEVVEVDVVEEDVVEVVVNVVVLVLDEVDVDVDVLVDVEVVVVVVSHPLQVLWHCETIGADVEHSCALKIRSHVARDNTFTLLAQREDVDTPVGVDVEMLTMFKLLEEAVALVVEDTDNGTLVVTATITMFEHSFSSGHTSLFC
jgi:hypothetical protein